MIITAEMTSTMVLTTPTGIIPDDKKWLDEEHEGKDEDEAEAEDVDVGDAKRVPVESKVYACDRRREQCPAPIIEAASSSRFFSLVVDPVPCRPYIRTPPGLSPHWHFSNQKPADEQE